MSKAKIVRISDPTLNDYYWVSTTGDVFKITKNKEGVKKAHPMSPFITRDGYVEYVLTRTDGTKKHIQAQRLVGLYHIGYPKSDVVMEVNHKDGDRSNNKLNNLEWLTKSNNILHSFNKLGKTIWNKGLKLKK